MKKVSSRNKTVTVATQPNVRECTGWPNGCVGRNYMSHERRSFGYQSVMTKLEIGHTGEFRRHPTKWSDPKDFSRDQTVPLVAAMGVHDDYERLERFYRELRRRNWFAQNGRDIMTDPVHRNLVYRARNES